MEASSVREIRDKKLYEASVCGNVQALEALMQEDGLLLRRVSLTWLDDTPAHIAAMCGHVNFTRALLCHKPTFASELDSLGRSPLHVACAEGHVDVVRELLRADSTVCKFHDGDGRTPFHLAAAKGRVEVLRELTKAMSGRIESTHDKLQVLQGGGGGGGETVLHLCVKYNRLMALKLVVDWVRSVADDVLEHDSIINSKDKDGNTIFHLAAALKQKETIEYLLQIAGVIEARNTQNENGFTALDVLEVSPLKDMKSMEIRDILLQADVQRARGSHQLHILQSTPSVTTSTKSGKDFSRWTICQRVANTWKRFFEMDEKWVAESRINLVTSAALIGSMAFQGALSPPGGVWSESKAARGGVWPDNLIEHEVGSSVAGIVDPDLYFYFYMFNWVSLLAALSTILLATSGFPLKKRPIVLLLMTTMCIAVGSIALAYWFAMWILIPQDQAGFRFREVQKWVVYIWLAICGFVMVIHVLRFFAWLIERRPSFCQKKSMRS